MNRQIRPPPPPPPHQTSRAPGSSLATMAVEPPSIGLLADFRDLASDVLQLPWPPMLIAGAVSCVLDPIFMLYGSWHFAIPHLLAVSFAILPVVFAQRGGGSPCDPTNAATSQPWRAIGRGAVALVLPTLALGASSWLFRQPGMLAAGLIGQLGILAIAGYYSHLTVASATPRERDSLLEQALQAERDRTLQLVLHFSLLGCMRDTERVFLEAMHILSTCFDFSQAVLYMANPAANEFRPVKTIGFSTDRLDGLTIKVSPDFWQTRAIDHEQGILGALGGMPQLPRLQELIPTCSLDSIGALPYRSMGASSPCSISSSRATRDLVISRRLCLPPSVMCLVLLSSTAACTSPISRPSVTRSDTASNC